MGQWNGSTVDRNTDGGLVPCYQVVEDTKLYKYRSEKNKQDYIGTAGVCGEMEGQVHFTAGRNIEEV